MALKSGKHYKRRIPFDEFVRTRVCGSKKKSVGMGRQVKFPEVSEEVQELLDANMDQVQARRRAREAFKEIQLSIDHVLFKTRGSREVRTNLVWTSNNSSRLKGVVWDIERCDILIDDLPVSMPCDGLKMKESYEVNSRGLEIFSKSWLPETCSPKAGIFFCHGYGDTITFCVEGIARRLASAGYGFFAMDYPGFGLSEGLHGFVPSFDLLVDDVVEHFSKVKENPDFRSLPSFLMGESMGGAVALKVHLKQPNAWNGAILVAPMCKIAADMVPPWIVAQFLIGVAKLLPKQKLVPQNDFGDMAFRDPKKRAQAAYNVISYKHRPRLGTAVELLRTTQEIEHQLDKVSLPLLILHGKADIVTDPSVSKALYEKAISSDKKLNLYDDAYHALLEGEPDETILRIFGDIISWLDEHTSRK